MPNVRTKPWMIAPRTKKKTQTQDVHVHVGSCDDNTLTLCNGGWSTTKPGADRQGQEQLDTSLGDVVHVQDMTNHLEMWRSHDFWIPKDGNILINSKSTVGRVLHNF